MLSFLRKTGPLTCCKLSIKAESNRGSLQEIEKDKLFKEINFS